jgi:hypothetical protein
MARKAVNLTLSEEVIDKGERLAAAETRPSLSNMVEALIVREHAARFPVRPSRKSPSPAQTVTTEAGA